MENCFLNFLILDYGLPIAGNSFSCELCLKQFGSQLKFFEHLKVHYEPTIVNTKVEPLALNRPLGNSITTPTIQDSFSIKSEFQAVS